MRENRTYGLMRGGRPSGLLSTLPHFHLLLEGLAVVLIFSKQMGGTRSGKSNAADDALGKPRRGLPGRCPSACYASACLLRRTSQRHHESDSRASNVSSHLSLACLRPTRLRAARDLMQQTSRP